MDEVFSFFPLELSSVLLSQIAERMVLVRAQVHVRRYASPRSGWCMGTWGRWWSTHPRRTPSPSTRTRATTPRYARAAEFLDANGTVEYITREEDPMAAALVATGDLPAREVLLSLPGELAATLTDVEQDEELLALVQAGGCSELVSLALFVAKHGARQDAGGNSWRGLIESLPSSVDSPIFWSEEERARLLRGSPVAEEAGRRRAALEAQWDALNRAPVPGWLTEGRFMDGMSVVLSHAVFLPSVGCFALLPIVGDLEKTGSESGAVVDYDAASNMVTVTSSISLSPGDRVKVYDGRPNGELFMATGCVERANPSDFMTLNASLIPMDRLYTMKEEVATAMGFSSSVDFPIFEDRFTTQHLAYLRMSRITDAAQMAKVSFENDVIISQENEYEILQLLMGDLREFLQGYETGMEEDVKELQRTDLTRRERMAALLRLGEKRVLRGTMDGVRTRLAPIRGIPTKSGGLQDPNADLVEIFTAIEELPQAPGKLMDGFKSWLRGDNDPDFKSRR